MKPINLKFTAFGPYPTTQTVDFNTLQNSNMFVIAGPTGSGKTTIFDAISFALYGSASGSERASDMFRSDFADDGDETSVEFTFEVRGEQYTIIRKPAQYRPKLRGSGFRKIEAAVTLTTPSDVYTNVSEVSSKIEELLGLSKDQFKQIVLLPQGEFKKLLVSDSRSKEEIFRKIFNTANIKRVQEQMRMETAELKRKIEDAELQIATILSNYPKIVTSSRLKLFQTNVTSNSQALSTKVETLSAELNQVNKLIEADREQRRIEKSLIEYQQKLAELEAKSEHYQLASDFLSNLQPTLEYQQASQQLQALKSELTNAQTELAELNTKLQTLNASQTEAEYNRAKAEFDNLEVLRSKKRTLEQTLTVIADQKAKLQTIEQYRTQANEKLTMRDQQVDLQTSLTKRLMAAKDAILKLEALTREYQSLEQVVQTLTNNVRVTTEIGQIEHKLEQLLLRANDLNIDYKSKSEQLISLRTSYFSAQAGNLAQTLVHNQPCPVCGSLEHPSPAILTDNQVTLEAIDDQEQIVNQTLAKLQVKTSEIDVNKALIAKLKSEYQLEDIDYKQQLDTVSTQLETLDSEIKKLDSQSQVTKLEEELRASALVIAELTSEINSYQLMSEKLEEQVTMEASELASAHKLQQDLEQIDERIEQTTADYNRLSQLLNQETRTRDNLVTMIKLLEESKIKNGELQAIAETTIEKLTSEYSAQTLIKYQQMLAREQAIRTDFEEYRQNLQLTEQKIIEFTELRANYQSVDLQSLESEFAQLRSALKQYSSLWDDYKVLSSKISDDLKALVKIESKSSRDIERYQLIADVSDIANGKTISKISFERYMLAIYFKQIISRANIYFKTMSNNRFELEYKQPHGGRSAQGLDLNIIDNYTSKVRDVKSLSGGESFKAALAMALGLSDIVQMNSGGVQIDTIFIDEGFGSLDSDSLNTAIDTLIQIEREGRMVGIISHVEELKNQINNKIEITPSPSGSSLVVNFDW